MIRINEIFSCYGQKLKFAFRKSRLRQTQAPGKEAKKMKWEQFLITERCL